MDLAPITLFVYNRLEHTKKTVEALKQNISANESELIIFSDGAKNNEASDKVKEVRNYLKTIEGFKNLRIIERDKNLGLANSIISGVTEIVNKYGKVIVLEDDLITSIYFLKYMNDALDLYENEDNVISIHGYIYPVKGELPETFFLKGADCWGWATWKRGWDLFEKDGKKLLKQINDMKLTYKFNYNNSISFTKMLEDQIIGKNNSWAIRWYASAFIQDKLTLYPGKSLVKNIGFDDSGTHCGNTDTYEVKLSNEPVTVKNIPIEKNKYVFKKIYKLFKGEKKNKTISILIKKIIKLFYIKLKNEINIKKN